MTARMKRLDHVNLRTGNLDAMVAWYGRILDMQPGPRPDFGFPGAWLYAGGCPIIHLVGREPAPGARPEQLRLEHFAISAEGLPEFLALLEAEGVPCELRPIRDFGVIQANIHDPDGNHIHIDFDLSEAKGMEI